MGLFDVCDDSFIYFNSCSVFGYVHNVVSIAGSHCGFLQRPYRIDHSMVRTASPVSCDVKHDGDLVPFSNTFENAFWCSKYN